MSKYISSEEEVKEIVQKCKRKIIEGEGRVFKKVLVEERECTVVAREEVPSVVRSRCTKCCRRLRVTNAFLCRCGLVYCGAHRYSDEHSCTYDYRGAERERIKTENPKVSSKKIIKF